MAALVDCVTGLQIAKALRKWARGKAPHLRGRKPADGMLMPHGAQPVNPRLVDVHPTAEPGLGVDAEWQLEARRSREWARRMTNRLPDAREQAGLANARDFQRQHWSPRHCEPEHVYEPSTDSMDGVPRLVWEAHRCNPAEFADAVGDMDKASRAWAGWKAKEK